MIAPEGAPLDPMVLHRHAESWQELSRALAAQRERVAELTRGVGTTWRGATPEVFGWRADRLVSNLDETARLAASTGDDLAQRSQESSAVVAVLREVAVEIAISAGWLAAAAVAPPLVAAAHARLVLLAAHAGRLVRLLARILAGLTRFLVRVRAWINEAAKLTWRTERFSFGYGRMLVDGITDTAVDVLVNTAGAVASNRPPNATEVLTSAAVSLAFGGLFGAAEASGVKRLMDDSGSVVRDAAGAPRFRSFGEQYKSAVNPADTRVPPTVSTSDSITARLAGAEERALRLDVSGWREEQVALHADRRVAEDELRHAEALHTGLSEEAVQAREVRDRTAEELRQRREEWWDAGTRLAIAGTTRDVERAAGETDWLRQAERELSAARDRHDLIRKLVARAEQVHQNHVRLADVAHDRAHAAGVLADEARATVERTERRAKAWYELAELRTQVRQEMTAIAHVTDSWRHNPWRDGCPPELPGFGAAKTVRELLLFDSVKHFAKGSGSSAAEAGISAARGDLDGDEIWQRTLVGGAVSSARGVANGSLVNVLVPKNGLEELLSKTATKNLDELIRDRATRPPA